MSVLSFCPIHLVDVETFHRISKKFGDAAGKVK